MAEGIKSIGRCPRLIEVAFPFQEVNAEIAREKTLQRGAGDSLFGGFGRLGLVQARAAIFASLVPDPDDQRCPKRFQKAVEHYLRLAVPLPLRYYYRGRTLIHDEDPYRPYKGVEDTLRHRLVMFIAKYSREALAFYQGKTDQQPKPGEILDDRSLVRLEMADPDHLQGREVVRVARELIKIAYHGPLPLLGHLTSGQRSFLLEAKRLGCRIAMEEGSGLSNFFYQITCLFPQQWGKSGRRSIVAEEFEKIRVRDIQVANVLAHDLQAWAHWVIKRAGEKIAQLYPQGSDARPVLGYLWARTVPCSNPLCRVELPLLRSLFLAKGRKKYVGLRHRIVTSAGGSQEIQFDTVKGKEREHLKGILDRNALVCPCCGQLTPFNTVRQIAQTGKLGEQMIAVMVEGSEGREYRAVEETDLAAFCLAERMEGESPTEAIIPEAQGAKSTIKTSFDRKETWFDYGFSTWGSILNPRQRVVMQTFLECLQEAGEALEVSLIPPFSRKERERDPEHSAWEREFREQGSVLDQVNENQDRQAGDLVGYKRVIKLYLGLWLSQSAMFMTSMGKWESEGQKMLGLFYQPSHFQTMRWSYPEANPFAPKTGCFVKQLEGLLRFLEAGPGIESFREDSGGKIRKGTKAETLPNRNGNSCTIKIVMTGRGNMDFTFPFAHPVLAHFLKLWLTRALGELKADGLACQDLFTQTQNSLDNQQNESPFLIRPSRLSIPAGQGLLCLIYSRQDRQDWSSIAKEMIAAGYRLKAAWPIYGQRKRTKYQPANPPQPDTLILICREGPLIKPIHVDQALQEMEQAIEQATRL